ncbi:MAG: hypothetical protein ABEK12_02265, partial [Candidatus Nanohaloarchaea archaeon]
MESITGDDRVLVVHHWDMDGSAAAAIVSEMLEETRGRPADRIVIPAGRQHTVGERAERIIGNDGITRLVILDMAVDGERLAELVGTGVDVLQV